MGKLKAVKEKVKKAVSTVKNKAKNLIKDPKMFKGENHGILWVPGSGLERSNYMGPGTNILGRLERGDKGKTAVDEMSKLHDIEYTLASGLAKDDNELAKMTRAADERMMYAGWNAFLNGRESWFNTLEGAGLIKAKTLLEDWGFMNRTKFLSPRSLKYRLDAEKRDATEYELLMRARTAMLNDTQNVNFDPHESSRIDTGTSLFNAEADPIQ